MRRFLLETDFQIESSRIYEDTDVLQLPRMLQQNAKQFMLITKLEQIMPGGRGDSTEPTLRRQRSGSTGAICKAVWILLHQSKLKQPSPFAQCSIINAQEESFIDKLRLCGAFSKYNSFRGLEKYLPDIGLSAISRIQ
jgi:hypothetical protein